MAIPPPQNTGSYAQYSAIVELESENPFHSHDPAERISTIIVGTGYLINSHLLFTVLHNIAYINGEDLDSISIKVIFRNDQGRIIREIRCWLLFVPQKGGKQDFCILRLEKEVQLAAYIKIEDVIVEEGQTCYLLNLSSKYNQRISTGKVEHIKSSQNLAESGFLQLSAMPNQEIIEFIRHDVKTKKGFSGSPIFVKREQIYVLIATHVGPSMALRMSKRFIERFLQKARNLDSFQRSRKEWLDSILLSGQQKHENLSNKISQSFLNDESLQNFDSLCWKSHGIQVDISGFEPQPRETQTYMVRSRKISKFPKPADHDYHHFEYIDSLEEKQVFQNLYEPLENSSKIENEVSIEAFYPNEFELEDFNQPEDKQEECHTCEPSQVTFAYNMDPQFGIQEIANLMICHFCPYQQKQK